MKDQKLTILGIGSGGREHALAASLKASPRVGRLIWLPGNPGIAPLAECYQTPGDNLADICRFIQTMGVDLTVVGPEAPLVGGLADRLQRRRLTCLGPQARGAKIEGSKVWCKRFLNRHGIPTARYRVFFSAAAAKAYLRQRSFPVVPKADGLCGGKGVTVAGSIDEAFTAVEDCLVRKKFGQASAPLIIEDCLVGRECSYTVLTDGWHVIPLATAMDYKRAFDGDQGPMTGGVGCVSPHPTLTRDQEQLILDRIVHPTVSGLQAEGIPYTGVLYFGLMLTTDGPQVLEINCRFGDPETQVILPRLQSDLVELLLATATTLDQAPHPTWSNDVAVCVTLCADSYPGKSTPGFTIYGLDEAAAIEGVQIVHAGTAKSGNDIVTAGGRVLHVVARGPTQAEARRRAYAAVSKIRFTGIRYRKDIAAEITPPP